MGVVVRKMTSDDIDDVAHIELQSVSPWSREQIAAELDYQRSVSYCAVSESEGCVGWCTVRTIGDESELLKIAVRTDYRRSGVGSALLEYLVATLQAQCVKDLFLEVRSQNIPAISFYSRLKFKEVGRRNDYYKKPDDDGLLFKKKIG
jgi:[ribosomal protein S18]-alanine N-acetyltransferase